MIRVYLNDDGELVYINQPNINRTLFPNGAKPDPVDIIIDPTETNVEIDGEAGKHYTCGELASLEITPPDEGIIDIVFTSGDTPTDVDIPETVLFSTELTIEANKVYEISILNGTLGAWLSWDVPADEDTPEEGGEGGGGE